ETVFKEMLEGVDLVLFSSEPYAFTEEHLDVCAEAYGVPRAKLRLIDGEMTSWYGPRAIAGLDYLRELASAAPSRLPDRYTRAGDPARCARQAPMPLRRVPAR